MATKIVTKNSSTASAVPTASDLVQGELAVNVADKRLFTEDNGGSVVELGTNPSTLTVTGAITANGGIALGDNDKATFGASDDLQIYHGGGHSYIRDEGTGGLILTTNGAAVYIQKGDTETSAEFNIDGAVQLRYDNAQKFATTSTGIDVTGTVTATELSVAEFLTSTNVFESNVSGEKGARLRAAISDAATPTFSFHDDTNTGMYSSGADTLNFSTAGAERMRIDSSGRVGIGTSPAVALDIAGSSTTQMRIQMSGQADTRVLSDTGTGIVGTYSNHPLTIKTNNSTVATIDTSGNVGIGTSSPARKIQTEGSGVLFANSGGTHEVLFGDNNYRYFSLFTPSSPDYMSIRTGTTDLLTVKADGNVGIGTNSPSSYPIAPNLVVDAGTSGGITVKSGANNYGGVFFADGTTGSEQYRGFIQYNHNHAGSTDELLFGTSGAERMRIDSSGSVLVGTTSSVGSFGANFEILGETGGGRCINTKVTVDTSANHISFHNGNGQIGSISTNGSATAYNTSSDQRLKENIADADDAGSKIDAIQVRQYDWKADGSHQDYGMIAQELQTVAPEAVSGDADSEEMMGVDYSKLVPMLIKEIQSLRNRVAQLEE
jgi:hypothetical protein